MRKLLPFRLSSATLSWMGRPVHCEVDHRPAVVLGLTHHRPPRADLDDLEAAAPGPVDRFHALEEPVVDLFEIISSRPPVRGETRQRWVNVL